MIDKTYSQFQKKIVPYLDGSLSPEEVSEFEAFVHTHPEFGAQIKSKEEEIQLLRAMIPVATLSRASHESLDSEIRASIYNLLKEEPKGLWDNIKMKFEEWISR